VIVQPLLLSAGAAVIAEPPAALPIAPAALVADVVVP
jgi:hypothetical protein